MPGLLTGTEPRPGGGVLRFARSELVVRVTAGGAVFWGWDGAEPTPSYAVVGNGPEPDPRAVLEPDTGGGWRVVSERVTVAVSRHGAVEVRTPGGTVLRRESPPRWWEPVEPGRDGARWQVRGEVPADARFFGLGGRAAGPRLRDGSYRLWNTDPKGGFGPGDDPLYLTMPVQWVVADAGTHLMFHDNTWDGRVVLREGEEGAGSGADRPGTAELRAQGGPLRCWVLVGTAGPGAPGLVRADGRGRCAAAVGAGLPARALGLRQRGGGAAGGGGVRVAGAAPGGAAPGHRPLRRAPGVHGGPAAVPGPARPGTGTGGGRGAAGVDRRPGRDGRGDPLHTAGLAVGERGAFVRDARGQEVRGEVWPGECAYPDFTDPAVRAWWGGLYEERLAQGFAGFWHDMNEPVAFAAFGDATLPRSARHVLEGAGGDHRAAHNVYALGMARAGWEGLVRLRPDERPFLFSRSGWAGMQRYGGTWSGDVESSWDGMRASLALVLGLGLCGVPYSGPDVGGFGGSPSPELFLRWFQLGSYLPLFRTHAAIWAGRMGAVGVRAAGRGGGSGRAGGAGAAAALLRDAGPSGTAVGGSVRAAAVVGGAGGPAAAGL